MNKNYLWLFLFLSVFNNPHLFVSQGTIMGTFYNIKIYQRRNPAVIFNKTVKELNNLEQKLSDYLPQSEISRINSAAGEKYIKVSPETLYLIKKALLISKRSQGAFDPTIRPLMEIWGFKGGRHIPPPEDKIAQVLKLTNWKNVMIKNNRVMLRKKGMKLDLGGVAKGYAVDKAIEVLKKEGVKNALVEIGGDLYCLGKGLNSQGWNIGIRDPTHVNAIIGEIAVSNKAVATSGCYENFFIWKGKRYSHIIDPTKGTPIQNQLLSVTIISPRCLDADAWATALFVSGWEKAQEIINSDNSLEGILIRNYKNKLGIWVSSGLKNKIKIIHEK